MHKEPQKFVEHVYNLQLFLNDLRAIIDLMSDGGRKVKIQIDDIVLDDKNELDVLAGQQATAKELKVTSFRPSSDGIDTHDYQFDIYLHSDNSSAYLSLDNARPESRGIFAEVSSVLHRGVVVQSGQENSGNKEK